MQLVFKCSSCSSALRSFLVFKWSAWYDILVTWYVAKQMMSRQSSSCVIKIRFRYIVKCSCIGGITAIITGIYIGPGQGDPIWKKDLENQTVEHRQHTNEVVSLKVPLRRWCPSTHPLFYSPNSLLTQFLTYPFPYTPTSLFTHTHPLPYTPTSLLTHPLTQSFTYSLTQSLT